MKIGLILGKFAPLHRGHQHVIETALAEMDQVIVLIYDCPELTTSPLPVRANWLRELYPTIEIVEAWDGPAETGLTPAITAQHDAYLKQKFAGRTITHFYSSEDYGAHVSRALSAIDRRIDMDRTTFPISATQVRADTFANREFLHPRVYRDLITQVVLLGAPSTGKTTLAQTLAQRHGTVWMPEFGREFWEQHQQDRRLTESQLVEIAIGHREREDILILQANQYFFIDTDATTTLQFSRYYHGRAGDELERVADDTRDRYDVFLLCEPDIPYDDTWDRSSEVSRIEMHRRVEADLLARRIPCHRVHGTVEHRCQQTQTVLQNFQKFQKKSGMN